MTTDRGRIGAPAPGLREGRDGLLERVAGDAEHRPFRSRIHLLRICDAPSPAGSVVALLTVDDDGPAADLQNATTPPRIASELKLTAGLRSMSSQMAIPGEPAAGVPAERAARLRRGATCRASGSLQVGTVEGRCAVAYKQSPSAAVLDARGAAERRCVWMRHDILSRRRPRRPWRSR
jgi:hypothetical protein